MLKFQHAKTERRYSAGGVSSKKYIYFVEESCME